MRAVRWLGLLHGALAFLLLASPVHSVVGGGPATQPYPHIAAMHLDGTFRCGASLVAPDTVLTAAHCVLDEGRPLPAERLSFVLGRHRLSGTGGETILVTETLPHEQYVNGFGPDVALVRLARPSAQTPVPIASQPSAWAPGTSATVIGWGVSSPYGFSGGTADDLQEVRITVQADDDCDFLSQTGKMDRATELCAGEMTGGKDACQGDSGGPLMAPDGSVIGVVSHGFGCGTPTQYGYYARVGDRVLRPWIVGRLAPPPAPAMIPEPPAAAPKAPRPAAKKRRACRQKSRKARKRCLRKRRR